MRDRIVEVAVETLAAHGASGFTARRIAADASTSVPAVYELFGDKAGLVREVFFEGFRQLGVRFEAVAESDDPVADLHRLTGVFREFVRANPRLVEVMFSRPFADFDPGPDEIGAGSAVRQFIVRTVQRAVADGAIEGDANDIAHVVVALVQGLAAQEAAGWLGTTQEAIDRRWAVAFRSLIAGLAPSSRPAGPD
jgi:AcrR family transcriptional regulator